MHVENPRVGENFCDHLMVRICYRTNFNKTVYDLLSGKRFAAAQLMKYLILRKGLFATPSFSVLAFVKSSAAEAIPDIRLQLGLTSGEKRLSNTPGRGFDDHSGFHLGGYNMYPRSRGSVHIVSTDANKSPQILANYLSAPTDRSKTLRVMRMLRDLGEQPALRPFIEAEVRPAPYVHSDEDLLDYIQATGETCWHPVGSCKMGPPEDGVVDTKLRVHFAEGLRVADASVMPFQISSNTNIPSIMIGERAAEFIREEHWKG
jgi:choline dehydrogenase